MTPRMCLEREWSKLVPEAFNGLMAARQPHVTFCFTSKSRVKLTQEYTEFIYTPTKRDPKSVTSCKCTAIKGEDGNICETKNFGTT
jgi:hypothetical protein